jgi:hypothetical protein
VLNNIRQSQPHTYRRTDNLYNAVTPLLVQSLLLLVLDVSMIYTRLDFTLADSLEAQCDLLRILCGLPNIKENENEKCKQTYLFSKTVHDPAVLRMMLKDKICHYS